MPRLLHESLQRNYACLRCFSPRAPDAPTKAALICAPHAGGSAEYFYHWTPDMPDKVALFSLQYPGRGDRLHEACRRTLAELLDDLMPALLAFEDTPYVLFGHSMGAVVMFEACHRLEALGHRPAGLVLSSHPPPDEVTPKHLYRLDDDTLWRETIRLGGTPAELTEHPELLALLTPILRADYQLIDGYRPENNETVQTPVRVCLGVDDPSVQAAKVIGWQRFCDRPIEIHKKSGGHFYLNEHRRALIELATRPLRSTKQPPPGDLDVRDKPHA